jgi:ribosomal protein S27E
MSNSKIIKKNTTYYECKDCHQQSTIYDEHEHSMTCLNESCNAYYLVPIYMRFCNWCGQGLFGTDYDSVCPACGEFFDVHKEIK